MASSSSFRLRGLIAAPFTPFHPDGALNEEMIPRLARSLSSQRVAGAFVCGTTGEGASLTQAERMKVAVAWRKAAPDGLAVIVHVGKNSVGEAQELAAHAQSVGADAVAAIAPSFFKPAGVDALVEYCAAVASAAPELPFYYYHMPSMTGVNLSVTSFLEAATGRIANLAGVKFTHEDLMDFGRARQVADGHFDLLFGRDEILLAGMALGAEGAVGSTYNYAARVYHRVIAAMQANDLKTARAEQVKAMAFIAAFVRHGGLNAGKAIMSLCGYDCGPMRSPSTSLEAIALPKLREDLAETGFFEFALRPDEG